MTDNTAAIVRAGSLPVCRILYELGHDPVMQLTCRDRNRIAMQSDLMGAHMLGIRNILCLTGTIRRSETIKMRSRCTIWIPCRSCSWCKG